MQSLMTALPSASPSTGVPHLPDGRFFSPQDMAFFAHTVQQTNFSNMTQIEDLTIDDNSNSFDSLDLHNPSAQMEEKIASTNNGIKRLESSGVLYHFGFFQAVTENPIHFCIM
ncbi:hypothetical protein WR25_16898 [Diploscapter pachys]|uniref:Uncharacterized protein n=1 Tax=Diploscapter pachys TaxID=2018661 RepID=A0A2A2LK94_9BILA|nr:hypothetical protein WR25_16898 [Diploscapter pachys]